jgi:hypothetical protein
MVFAALYTAIKSASKFEYKCDGKVSADSGPTHVGVSLVNKFYRNTPESDTPNTFSCSEMSPWSDPPLLRRIDILESTLPLYTQSPPLPRD